MTYAAGCSDKNSILNNSLIINALPDSSALFTKPISYKSIFYSQQLFVSFGLTSRE